MKKGSTLFLKILLALGSLGVAGLAFVVIPTEGGWPGFNEFGIILIIFYASLIPFFFAIYQTWRLLDYIDANKAFSDFSVKALKNIKYSAAAFSLLYLGLLPFLFIIAQAEDAPGVAAIGLVFVFSSGAIATFVAIIQRLFEEAIIYKSENELTV